MSGKRAWLSVNGGNLIALDVSKKVVRGDVGVTAGSNPKSENVGYGDFAIVPVVK